MLFAKSLVAAALALAASVSAGTINQYDGSNSPISLVDAWPAILSPKAGETYHAGGNLTVTWSQSLADKYDSSELGQTASISLFYTKNGSSTHLDTQTIAENVNLYNGSNTIYVKLPSDLPTRDSYKIALIGSSGDTSDAFTVEGSWVSNTVEAVKEIF